MNSSSQAPSGVLALLSNNIERVVALAIPLVFTPASIVIVKWVTTITPGSKLTPDQVTAALVSGVVAVVAAGIKWLHGRQVWAKAAATLASTGITHEDLDAAIEKLYAALAPPDRPATDGLPSVVIEPASPAPPGDWTPPAPVDELRPAGDVPAA